MPGNLIWLELADGRSVIGSCGDLPRESFDRLLDEPGSVVTLTDDDSVERVPADEIRSYRVLDSKVSLPAHTSSVRFVAV